MPALINVNAHSSNDDSFKITLPSTRLKPSITPPSIGLFFLAFGISAPAFSKSIFVFVVSYFGNFFAGVSVSSSVSKTPSPLYQSKSSPEEAEKNLEKVGQVRGRIGIL